MFAKFERRDVVREVHHETGIGVVGAGQVEGVRHAQGLLFNDVVDAFARKALTNMFCDLPDELV